MAKKKNKKVIRYRRRLNTNVGIIIFAIIFIYLAFSVYTYMKKEKVQFYEVVEGNIVNDSQHTGIILRDEMVQTAEDTGYINYYVREGKRAAIGTRIYSIDQTGSLAAFLADNPDANASLTDANMTDIKRQLSSFSLSYTDRLFDEIYDLQHTLEAAVLEYVNFNTLGSLDALIEQTGITFQQVRAPVSGVVSYSIDGYEGMTPSQITEASFDRSGYAKAITKAGQLIEKDAPVYKLVSSDHWSIVFPMSQEDIERYGGKSQLNVRFNTNDLETTADFAMITGSDGKPYGQLDFDQYMVQFVSERFVTFEVDSERVEGLKIPVSAVTDKMFYLVPVSYLVPGGSTTGFLKEVYSAEGTTAEFVPATIYYSTDTDYYIDMGDQAPLKSGDYIVKPDSSERYQIGRTDSLKGVYNINKGYAVFKQIEILKSNDEYYTIRKGMDYGLYVYDHIVLNAETVYEGELIYQ
ncbi:MAG: hypothetical protein HFG64_08270 [Lachnospiraceae bacterium]|nr:hypothetical protein [Lachnospiraceae bacterium]